MSAARSRVRCAYRAGWLAASWLFAITATSACFAQQTAAQPAAIESATGTLDGVVQDADGRMIPGAQLLLLCGRPLEERPGVSDASGAFRFENVPTGGVKVTGSASGLAAVSLSGVLRLGEDLQLPPLVLGTATSTTTIDVTKTREELAEVEIHQQEQQRLLGALPNFFVSYTWDAQPLTARQKFKLDVHQLYDPATFVLTGLIAGVQQADDAFPGFHQGALGYAKRYGANYADVAIGTTLGGAVFPSLFRQDPRYFYKGTGTKVHRALYALSTAVRQRGDNGKWQVAYSSMLGDIASGAISNLYYPASDRQGASLTLENGFLSIAFDGIGNLVQEFVFKAFSTGVAKNNVP